MTTTRRLSYEWPGKWVRGQYSLMQRRLDTWCHSFWWFDDGVIEGEPFGRLQLTVIVSAQDQWCCMERGAELAKDVFAVAGIRRPPRGVVERFIRKGPPPK
jgi:hypothetical protein